MEMMFERTCKQYATGQSTRPLHTWGQSLKQSDTVVITQTCANEGVGLKDEAL